MGLLQLVVVLAVIGVVLWLIETQIPMDQTVKTVIRVVVVVVVCLWLLSLVGLLPNVPLTRLPP